MSSQDRFLIEKAQSVLLPENICPTCEHSMLCAQYPSPEYLALRYCGGCSVSGVSTPNKDIVQLVAVYEWGSLPPSLPPPIHTCREYASSAAAVAALGTTAKLKEGVRLMLVLAGRLIHFSGFGWLCRACSQTYLRDDRTTDVNSAWRERFGEDPFSVPIVATREQR